MLLHLSGQNILHWQQELSGNDILHNYLFFLLCKGKTIIKFLSIVYTTLVEVGMPGIGVSGLPV